MTRDPIGRGDRNWAAYVAVVIGLLLIVNGVARLAEPQSGRPGIPLTEASRVARDVWRLSDPGLRYDILSLGSRVAAGLEATLGALLVVGWRRRLLVGVLGGTVIVFSLLLVVAAIAKWPVSECRCIATIRRLPLSIHLIANGTLILVTSALWPRLGEQGAVAGSPHPNPNDASPA